MTQRVIIPIKALDQCKARLRPLLHDEERRMIVRSMLERVIAAARDARGIDNVAIVGPSDHGTGLDLLQDSGADLNAAAKIAALQSAGAFSRIIIVSADLPLITAADIETLTEADAWTAVIAPDHNGSGTNAISLPDIYARDFNFQFGPQSFARHRDEAQRLGLKLAIARRTGLACDIDLPADLCAIAPILH